MPREGLAELAAAAAREPLADREPLFRALLDSPVHLLRTVQEAAAPGTRRVFRGGETLALWTEPDVRWETVWVPVFSGPEAASRYLEYLERDAPEGEVFEWVRVGLGDILATLQAVPRFAGLLVDSVSCAGVRLEWDEVDALSAGRLPEPAPVLHRLADEPPPLPADLRCVVGACPMPIDGEPARQLVFPETEGLELQDFRRLVSVGEEGNSPLWTPCRHLAATLLRVSEAPERAARLAAALIDFRMLGEAEAVCERLARAGPTAAIGLVGLARALHLAGKLDRCIEVCRQGLDRYPEQLELYLNLARAHAQTEDLEAAREVARRGISRFPHDAELERFL